MRGVCSGMTWPPLPAGPIEQPLHRPAVDDAVGWDACKPRVSDGCLRVGELFGAVGIAVEGEQAPALDGEPCKIVIDVLARGVAVDLDRHMALRRFGEDAPPV